MPSFFTLVPSFSSPLIIFLLMREYPSYSRTCQEGVTIRTRATRNSNPLPCTYCLVHILASSNRAQGNRIVVVVVVASNIICHSLLLYFVCHTEHTMFRLLVLQYHLYYVSILLIYIYIILERGATMSTSYADNQILNKYYILLSIIFRDIKLNINLAFLLYTS